MLRVAHRIDHAGASPLGIAARSHSESSTWSIDRRAGGSIDPAGQGIISLCSLGRWVTGLRVGGRARPSVHSPAAAPGLLTASHEHVSAPPLASGALEHFHSCCDPGNFAVCHFSCRKSGTGLQPPEYTYCENALVEPAPSLAGGIRCKAPRGQDRAELLSTKVCPGYPQPE
jgi:hypothetical protein